MLEEKIAEPGIDDCGVSIGTGLTSGDVKLSRSRKESYCSSKEVLR